MPYAIVVHNNVKNQDLVSLSSEPIKASCQPLVPNSSVHLSKLSSCFLLTLGLLCVRAHLKSSSWIGLIFSAAIVLMAAPSSLKAHQFDLFAPSLCNLTQGRSERVRYRAAQICGASLFTIGLQPVTMHVDTRCLCSGQA